jgi:hypothetical protein
LNDSTTPPRAQLSTGNRTHVHGRQKKSAAAVHQIRTAAVA